MNTIKPVLLLLLFVTNVYSQELSEIEKVGLVPGFTGSASFRSVAVLPGVGATLTTVKGVYVANRIFSRGATSIKAADAEIDVQEFAMQGPNAFSKNSEEVAQKMKQLKEQNLLASGLAEVTPYESSKEAVAFHSAVEDIIDFVGKCATLRSAHQQLEIKDGKLTLKAVNGLYNLEPLAGVTPILAQSRANELLNEEMLVQVEQMRVKQYPMLSPQNACGVPTDDSLEGLLMSRMHSSDCAQTKELLSGVVAVSKAPFVRDVLEVIATGIVRGPDYPSAKSITHYPQDEMWFVLSRKDALSLVHCQDEVQLTEHSKHLPKEIGGYYSPQYNVVTFSGNATDHNFTPYFVHEATHAVMNLVFRNEAKPYGKDNLEEKASYESAETECFRNLARVLGVSEEDLSRTDSMSTSDVIWLIKDESRRPPRESLTLSSDDDIILAQFASLIKGYAQDHIKYELIVRIPQLIAMGVSEASIARYFEPLMKHWEKYVSQPLSVRCDD